MNERAIKYFEWANDFFSKADYRAAVLQYTEAIAANKFYYTAYINRGNAFVKLGNYQRALADYSQVILLDPEARVPITTEQWFIVIWVRMKKQLTTIR